MPNRYQARLLMTGVSALLFVAGSFCPARSQSTADTAVQPYRFDAALRAQLSPDATPVAQGLYSIKLPAGYTPLNTPMDAAEAPRAGGSLDRFSTPYHADGTHPVLGISVGPLRQHSGPLPPTLLSTWLKKNISNRQQKLQETHFSPAEYGTLNGIPFARVYFRGILDQRQEGRSVYPVRGFVYVCIDQDKAISITGLDDQNYSSASMPLLDAAALTFTRAQQ